MRGHFLSLPLSFLPAENVLSVERSGKARAVKRAIEHFSIVRRYSWIHVADADSIFCPHYFRIYLRHLDGKKWCACVGFVQSMPGNWIAKYRSFSYTYGQHILGVYSRGLISLQYCPALLLVLEPISLKSWILKQRA